MYHCTTFGQNHQIILFFARHRKVRAALLMIFLALLEQFKMCSKVFFLTFEEEEGMKIFSRSNMTWVYFKQAYTIHIFGGRIPTAVSAIFFRLYAHKASKQKCVYLHTSSFCNYHKYSGFFFSSAVDEFWVALKIMKLCNSFFFLINGPKCEKLHIVFWRLVTR